MTKQSRVLSLWRRMHLLYPPFNLSDNGRFPITALPNELGRTKKCAKTDNPLKHIGFLQAVETRMNGAVS
jgi:hypothetical protein